MVGDLQFRNACPEGEWFFQKFQDLTLVENTDAQHGNSQSKKHRSPGIKKKVMKLPWWSSA